MDDTIRQGFDDIVSLEKVLGLAPGFFDSLRNEDDWSVVIKCHALIESAATRMLTLYFGKAQLNDVFANMEMSNKKSGKAAFISKLKLLDTKQRGFISRLSELRNQLVHDISNVGVSLTDFLQRLSKDKRDEYIKSLNIRLESVSVNGEVFLGEDLILKKTKYVIWSSTLICLSNIWTQCVFAAKRNEIITEFLRGVEKPITINPLKVSLSLNSLPD